ncbi:MAG: hypothetical protein P8090_07180, partial [Gammaproteobacteria bacterium]
RYRPTETRPPSTSQAGRTMTRAGHAQRTGCAPKDMRMGGKKILYAKMYPQNEIYFISIG